MGASITLAGESLIAQKQGAKQTLDVVRFVLANVPGLDPTAAVDRAAGKPVAAQIVGTYPLTQAGFVNPNQVVYSLMLGSDVGDFDFNWIGLETAENVLLAVAYLPVQQKRRNIPPQQIGNNLTRNFLVVFDGAKDLTAIHIDASTWQHDFTARLIGMDERERLSNRDMFGRACFFGSSLQLEKVGTAYQVKAGTAYVEGIRLQVDAVKAVAAPTSLPTVAWLDVALQRDQSNVSAAWRVAYGADVVDYTDNAGVRHYCVPIADVSSAGVVTERRSVEGISGPLVAHFAARTGDYPLLRARATTKDDVGLSQIPNALSDDPESNSSVILATTKAVKAVTVAIWSAIANIVSGATIVGAAARLATARRITVTGAVVGNASFDGTGDVTLHTVTAPASEASAGGARVATQPQTDQGVDDATIVSPKKLRFGFSCMFGINGYIIFPSWLAGPILQWGEWPAGSSQLSFPVAFPNAGLQIQLTANTASGTPSSNIHYYGQLSKIGFTRGPSYTDSMRYLVIGH